MTDELIAYLLDDLPAAQRVEVEQRIEQDPKWRQELDRLQDCLAGQDDLGGCDAAAPELPEDLADRTCTLVDSVCGEKPLAGLSESSERSRCGSRWSLSDLCVATGVLLVLSALLMPAMQQTRADSRRTACENNLRVMGTALFDYANDHKQDEKLWLPPIGPNENVGAFALKLVRAGYLTPQAWSQSLVCPGSKLADQLSRRQVLIRILTKPSEIPGEAATLHVQMWPLMSGSYAYRLGYFDEDGKYSQVNYTGNEHTPMLSDAPSLEMASFGSDNHGGKGQNIMFQDLSVRYVTNCSLRRCDGKEDHPFLNDNKAHAAGVSKDDVVLGRSECTALGPLAPVSQSIASRCSSTPQMLIFVFGLNAEASVTEQ